MSKNLKGAIRNISRDRCYQRSLQSLAINGVLVYIPPSKYGSFANSRETLLTSHVGIMHPDEYWLHNKPRPLVPASKMYNIVWLSWWFPSLKNSVSAISKVSKAMSHQLNISLVHRWHIYNGDENILCSVTLVFNGVIFSLRKHETVGKL